MTRLDRAIALIKTLPDSEQERAANALIAFADEHANYSLSDEQIEGIKHAITQADEGQFATDEDVTKMFGKAL